jgi:UDP-GlcNAc:undecaprenyl-phosphate GlcNAc-1-phosphate transferase
LPLEARLLVGLAIAVAVAHLATPLAIRVAERLEFYDRPVGYKGHAAPTPYLGGAAVVTGFIAAIALLAGSWDKTLPLVGGVLVLWVVGTIDDRRTLRPLTRVAVEVALAACLWSLDLGWKLGLGDAVDVAMSAIWIVAVVNAFNLFDNMDGAASSMAAVVAAGLAVLGVAEGDTWLAVTAAALCGASVGFLPHNLFASPARIFLGDGGSMPLGFAVAAVAMIGVSSAAAAAWQSLAMGLLFVGIPALDTALVTISRRRRGVSILTGGRDHLTHRARQRLRTTRAVAVTLGGAQAVISALAVVALRGGETQVVLAVVAYLVGLGVAITLLDARFDAAPGIAPGGAVATTAPAPRGFGSDRAALLLLVPLAIGIAASPFAFGYYDASIWVPVGLGLLGVATAGLIARPVRLPAPAVLLLGSITAIGVWALLSALWADSVQQAVVEGNRWLAYSALLAVLLVLVRQEQTLLVLLGTLAAGMGVVGIVVLVRMLGSGAPDLVLGGRLNEPLGYINGLASFMLLGAWLCVGMSERRQPALAALGAAGATLLGGLAILSQSRGVALAAAISVIVVLVLMPGRIRRGWALVVIGAAIASAAPALLDVYETSIGGPPSADVMHTAAERLAVAALAAGAIWGVALRVLGAVPATRSACRAGGGMLLAGVAVALVIGLASAGRIADTLHRQYDAFVHLSIEPRSTGAPVETSRLVSGAGNRYDYWRVAWDAWRSDPVAGVGAGNYDIPYFRNRTTTEDVRQPHSIELQLASELGLVGICLLALALVGIGWGAWRARRVSGTAAACVGVVVAWLVHASVDWIHLLPGVTAVALVAAAALVYGGEQPPTRSSDRRRGRAIAAVVAATVVVISAVSLTRQALTERYQDRARAALAADPARAIQEADRALRLDPDAIGAYYVKSAALARFNEAAAAQGALEAALRRDPSDFVTWALLGDLAVRAGQLQEARSRYERALALNPLDPSLKALAADPRTALSEP